jgi:ABC-type polysaccharide/polyol phosphate transport system ATPase subunit
MTVGIRADNLGVRFQFDRTRHVITPARARLSRRVSEAWGLRGLDLVAAPGEAIALLGPTGSGKTTLLRAIAGVMPADEGTITVGGRVASMISINAGLIDSLTGRENAMLLGVLTGLSRAACRKKLESIGEQSQLEASYDRPASSYSQGMRARLAFTATTQFEPDILVLDEVHEAFDHQWRERLTMRCDEIRKRGGIVVAAGHDHPLLSHLCERAVLLSDGRIAAGGTFEEVRAGYVGDDDDQGGAAPA